MRFISDLQIRLQVLLEPRNSLVEGLLLAELEMLVAQVSTDSEAMCNAAEQVDLPRLTCLDQDTLGLVTKLSGEDVVDF
jgi:hypothetical protein